MNPNGCGAMLPKPLATSPRPKRSPRLARLLSDDNCDYVRHNAALSLAKIGPGAEAAYPALNLTLDDENIYVRENARLALARIKTA